MLNNPLVSIITPLYNKSMYLKDTIDSVLNQQYENFEWIIVDDCSTDDSFKIVSSIKDKRVKAFRLEKNSGVAVVRNYALDQAKGKYVTFLDADDMLDDNYLLEQVKFIQENGPIISSGYRRKADNTITDFYVPDTVTYKDLYKGNPLSCLTTMYDFELINDLRFPLGLSRHEDYLFWIRLLQKGYAAKGNHQILATYRIYNDSRNRSKVCSL